MPTVSLCWRGGCGAPTKPSSWRSISPLRRCLTRRGANPAPIATDAERFFRLPAEVALRLLGRAIVQVGEEGPVQLAKLEMLYETLREATLQAGPARLRRTLAGALIALSGPKLAVERAPPRKAARRQQQNRLTTRPYDRRKRPKHR